MTDHRKNLGKLWIGGHYAGQITNIKIDLRPKPTLWQRVRAWWKGAC